MVVQTLARLAVFNLTRFDRIVVLEADMVMVRPCDELFDIPVFAAMSLAGGRMVVRASTLASWC